MHTVTIFSDAALGLPITRAEFTFPSGWDEVTVDHLLAIARVLSKTSDPIISRFLLLHELAGVPVHATDNFRADDVFRAFPERIAPDNPLDERTTIRWKPIPQLDWCYTQPVFRKSLFPSFRHDGTGWAGPADRLENFTVSRFAFADSLLAAAAGANGGEQLLDQLLAAIYQPAGRPWSNEAIEPCAGRLASLPAETKLLAVMNYRGLRGFLPSMFPRVFSGSDEPLDSGLFGMIYDVSTSGVFGDIDKTEQQPLLRVLAYLDHQIEKDQREARQLESHSA